MIFYAIEPYIRNIELYCNDNHLSYDIKTWNNMTNTEKDDAYNYVKNNYTKLFEKYADINIAGLDNKIVRRMLSGIVTNNLTMQQYEQICCNMNNDADLYKRAYASIHGGMLPAIV